MADSVSKSRFKARALEYFRQVQKTGKGLVITDRGRPVLRVVPYTQDPSDILKDLRNTVLRYDRPTEPVGLDDWETIR